MHLRYSFSKDTEVIFASRYNMFMERLTALKTGDQTVVPDPLIFEKFDGLRDLANNFGLTKRVGAFRNYNHCRVFTTAQKLSKRKGR
jgi:hypothetical protein